MVKKLLLNWNWFNGCKTSTVYNVISNKKKYEINFLSSSMSLCLCSICWFFSRNNFIFKSIACSLFDGSMFLFQTKPMQIQCNLTTSHTVFWFIFTCQNRNILNMACSCFLKITNQPSWLISWGKYYLSNTNIINKYYLSKYHEENII